MTRICLHCKKKISLFDAVICHEDYCSTECKVEHLEMIRLENEQAVKVNTEYAICEEFDISPADLAQAELEEKPNPIRHQEVRNKNQGGCQNNERRGMSTAEAWFWGYVLGD